MPDHYLIFMREPWVRRVTLLVVLFAGVWVYRTRASGPVDAAAIGQDSAGPRLRIAIVGNPADARIAPAREAVAYWNRELLRLRRRVHFDSGTVIADSVPDELLRGASSEAVAGRGPATTRLRATLSDLPADIVIVLSGTDLISFGVPWREGSQGIVGMRRADIPPLSLPNTVRNVVAHELGHVLGLRHNTDAATLMCGRPAPCRPAAFASDSSRFFPLTAQDDRRLQARWP